MIGGVAIGALAKRAGGGLLKLLNTGVTMPVWLIGAVALWLWFDQASSVRQAVTSATQELVAGARITALETRLNALETLNADEAGRALALEQANANLTDLLSQSQHDLENANDEIAELMAQPPPPDGDVDHGLAGRLRNR